MKRERQNLVSSITWISNEDVLYNFNEEEVSTKPLPDTTTPDTELKEKKITIISPPIDMLIIR